MGVEINVIDRRFSNPYTNGTDLFGGGVPTDNLTGFADERCRAIQSVVIESFSKGTTNSPFVVTGGGTNWQITRFSGSFLTDGFYIGDDIFIDIAIAFGFTGSSDGNVVTVNDLYMTITTAVAIGEVPEGAAGTVTIWNTEPILALKYSFGLNPNDDEFSNINLITGSDQSYSFQGIDTTLRVMTPDNVDTNRDWITDGRCAVRKTFTSLDLKQQTFEIDHTFRINPSYKEGQLSNYENEIITPLYLGDNSIKYTSRFEWRTVISNPNTSRTAITDVTLGSVGLFNENFNGLKNNYLVDSIEYFDDATGLAESGILKNGLTRLELVVQVTTRNYGAGDRFGLIIKKLPTEEEYTDTLTGYEDNFLMDDAYHTYLVDPVISTPNGIIKTITTVSAGADKIKIIATISYFDSQKPLIDEDTKYVITAIAGDILLDAPTSDRVALLADVNTFDVSSDIPDLVSLSTLKFYPEYLPLSTGLGFTSFQGWNYDNYLVDFRFEINLAKSAFINSISGLWVAYDPITDEFWEIDKVPFQYTEVLQAGVQQLNLDTTRGFHLEDGSDYNLLRLQTGARVVDTQTYTGQVALRVDWADWQPDSNVDNVFFDIALANGNQNKKSSNYSNLNGYELHFFLDLDMAGVSTLGIAGDTRYIIASPVCTALDKDLDDNIPALWDATIETFTEDGLINLGGAIKEDGNTLFKTTFNQVSGPVVDLTNYWATHKIENVLQLGLAYDKLSTENFQAANNKLTPVAGEALLKKELIAGDVVTTCLIDGPLVLSGQNLIARLGTKDNVPSVLPDGKITTDSDVKEDTDNTAKEMAL